MRASLAASAVALAAGAALVVACSSTSGNPDYPTPAGCPTKYDCDAGDTCWSNDGVNCSCMPAGDLLWGAPCVATGPPQCGAGQTCYATGSQSGKCAYWCDPSNKCPAGSGTCTKYESTTGISLSACL
jgi:hypothetical protein